MIIMFRDNFIAVIKHNDAILREDVDTVTLPFGSEYSILLKNLNSKRASVDITIDGEDVLNGNSLVLQPNSILDLKGFLENNDEVKKKFKFINKTKEIADYRGDRIDDGLIRIEFAYEKPKTWSYTIYNAPFKMYNGFWNIKFDDSKDFFWNGTSRVTCSAVDMNTPAEDEGITVKGGDTSQKFHATYINELEPSQVMILKLKGVNKNGKDIKQSITTKDKITCPVCGKPSRSDAKFCYNCGTALT